MGDGDLGVGLKRGCENVLESLNSVDLDNHLQSALIKLADGFSDSFGGTSGPLWGVFFTSMANSLNNV